MDNVTEERKSRKINFGFIEIFLPGKFSLKDTVINIVAGLGLISFITMFCDFIMLNYVSERKAVSDGLLALKLK